MGEFEPSAQAADGQVLLAPVKLKGLAELEMQGNEAHAHGGMALLLFVLPAKGIDLCLATAVTHGANVLKVGIDGAPKAFAAARVGLEPLSELLFVRIKQTRCFVVWHSAARPSRAAPDSRASNSDKPRRRPRPRPVVRYPPGT